MDSQRKGDFSAIDVNHQKDRLSNILRWDTKDCPSTSAFPKSWSHFRNPLFKSTACSSAFAGRDIIPGETTISLHDTTTPVSSFLSTMLSNRIRLFVLKIIPGIGFLCSRDALRRMALFTIYILKRNMIILCRQFQFPMKYKKFTNILIATNLLGLFHLQIKLNGFLYL